MAEKVIFEFRADRDEGGCGFHFGSGMDGLFDPSILACCRAAGIPGMPRAGGPKRSRRSRDHGRHHMRETLDFFERMYNDLFSGAASSQSREPEQD